MKSITTLLSTLLIAAGLQAGEPTMAPSKGGPVVQPADTIGNAIFTGIDVRNEAWYSHVGYIRDLDGDFSTSGLFLRGFAGYGQYDYDYTAPGVTNITGTVFDADLGLGYRHVAGNMVYSAFAALHVRDRDLDSFDANRTEDTDFGARFGLDATGTFGNLYVSGMGMYSTVEEAIWLRGRVGYQFGRVTVGPEVVYLSDAEFDEVRYGLFAQFKCCDRLSITGSIGHADYEASRLNNNRTEGLSIYGTLGMTFAF
jgi:Cellulose biosynthesis protein BcsS